MKAIAGAHNIKQKYELIEHTADTGISLEAGSLEEIFALAACAMFDLTVDVAKVKPAQKARVSLEAESLEELLITWLNELLFRADVSGMFFSRFEVLSVSDHHIEAVIEGEPYNEKEHPLGQHVKAATYHELRIFRKNGTWGIRVIFDI